jgi:hypothetical protein
MPSNTITSFADWLDDHCQRLRNLEAEAEHMLYQEKNQEKYAALMHQKARMLQNLAQEAAPRAATLPEAVAASVMQRLERFSGNATRALSIGSIFYMYALLYPDNHVKGQPNNLDILVAEIRVQAGQEEA